jgi:hypothetical protein
MILNIVFSVVFTGAILVLEDLKSRQICTRLATTIQISWNEVPWKNVDLSKEAYMHQIRASLIFRIVTYCNE